MIDDTFNSRFDREKFIEFVMHLFKLSREEIENTTKGPWQKAYVPLAFSLVYILRYEVIARCKLHDDSEVDALIVYLQDDKGIDRDRSRTMERNFIGCYLAGRYGGELLRDGVIVAFVPKCMDDWRFSFVMLSADIDKADENGRIVPAIRWSFLVGANEHNNGNILFCTALLCSFAPTRNDQLHSSALSNIGTYGTNGASIHLGTRQQSLPSLNNSPVPSINAHQ